MEERDFCACMWDFNTADHLQQLWGLEYSSAQEQVKGWQT